MVVVSERSKTQGKSSEASNSTAMIATHLEHHKNTIKPTGSPKRLSALKYGILLALGSFSHSSISYADTAVSTRIIADPRAPKIEQPTILPTASGITQVNIQSPSAAGVSKNQYSQFDVGQQGAILNNSHNHIHTQLAGMVEANPYLARGEAKVILNQVNSNQPSQLHGYVEVAGKKAEVVIANPSGIQINGGGFINASRSTLTTGQAQLQQGALTGFKVTGGHINIHGKGLNQSQSDYSQIISQTVQLNAKIHAQQLDIITGDNQVSYTADGRPSQVDTLSHPTANNQATGISLDISQLGGMYAGHIRLIGTQKGMGVTNVGDIQSTGTLHLDQQGKLTNTGTLSSQQQLNIKQAQDIDNSGTINSSTDKITLDSQELHNRGLIASYSTLQANTQHKINNSGAISAGQFKIKTEQLNNQGQIAQTGTGQLSLDSQALNNKNKAVIGQSLYADQATPKVNLAQAPTTANTGSQSRVISDQSTSQANNPAQAPTNTSSNNSITLAAVVTGHGQIIATQLNNQGDKASIIANGAMQVHSQRVRNQNKSSIAVMALDTQSLSNHNSRMQQEQIDWHLNQLDNRQGQIVAKNIAISTTQNFNNQQGIIATTGNATLQTSQAFNNEQGTIQGNQVHVTAQNINNHQGQINSQQQLSLDSHDNLNNQAGRINSQAASQIKAGDINNSQGQIFSAASLNIQGQHLTNSGQIYAGQDAQLKLTRLDNVATGLIGSTGQQTITTQDIHNTGTLAAGLEADGKLSAQSQDLSVTASQQLVSHGIHIATGEIHLSGQPMDLSTSQSQAGRIALSAQGDLSTQGAKLTATEQINLTVTGKIDNRKGNLTAKTLVLSGNALDNSEGQLLQTGNTDLSLSIAAGIDNNQGRIASNSQNLTVKTVNLNNQAGKIEHAGQGTLTIHATQINNSNAGAILSAEQQQWQVSQGINNQNGTIQGKQFTLQAKQLNNSAGRIQAADGSQTSVLQIQGELNNQAGTISNNQAGLALQAQQINNAQGQILSLAEQTWRVAQGIDNNQGQIQASQFNIQAQELNNNAGRIIASTQSIQSDQINQINQINVTGQVKNTDQAVIYSDTGSLDIKAQGIENQGQIYSRSDIQANSTQLTNSGNIYSQGKVTIHNQAELNNTGSISAKGDIALAIGSFKQSATGQLIAGLSEDQKTILDSPQNLTVHSRDGQDNQGKNFATGQIDLQGSILNLQHSQIQAKNIKLQAKTGELNLSQANVVAQHQAKLSSQQQLNNDEGILQAAQFDFNVAALSNQKGQISQTGHEDFHLHTGQINNHAGAIGVKSANMMISSRGDLNNTAGQIIHIGEGHAKINAHKISNSHAGTLLSNANLTLQAKTQIDNQQQSVIQGRAVSLDSQELNNQNSQILSSQDLTINTSILNNTKNATLVAQRNIAIQTHNMDNQQGYIQAKQDLTLQSTGNVNNQAGTIGSQKNLSMSTAQDINNQAGQLWSETIQLQAHRLDNAAANSLISAQKDLTLHVAQINNQNTRQITRHADSKIEQGIIAGGNLNINAAVVNNQAGQILTNQNAQLVISQQLNNQAGEIRAGESSDATAQNYALTVIGQNIQVNNQQGVLQAKDVTLQVKGIDNHAGHIRALEHLNISQQQDYQHTATDELNANHLSLHLTGHNLINTGILAGKTSLTVTASHIDNQKDGQLISEGLTHLNVRERITNRGLINGEHTYLKADQSINNLSGGRIYGTHLAIKADTLNNTPDIANAAAPVIAARTRLDIGVKHLNNNPNTDRAHKFNRDFNGQAQILSHGELHIGGDLEQNHQAIGRAEQVVNKGATIQSLGDMVIATEKLQNINADWQMTTDKTLIKKGKKNYFNGYTINPIFYDESQITFIAVRKDKEAIAVLPDGSYLGHGHGEDWHYNEYDLYQTQDRVLTSDPSRLVTGQNLTLHGQQLINHASQMTVGINYQQLGDKVEHIANHGEKKELVENGHTYFHYLDGRKKKKKIDYIGEYLAQPKLIESYELPILDGKIDKKAVISTDITTASIATLNQGLQQLTALQNPVQTSTLADALKALQDFKDSTSTAGQLNSTSQQKLDELLVTAQKEQVIDKVALGNLINDLNQQLKQTQGQEIRSLDQPLQLAHSALYTIHPKATQDYLVETDPAFTSGKAWLGSDYMLKRLYSDPTHLHKRLGDGYYEQGIIRDQIIHLTGKRYLGDYRNDEQQYQALMDNGLTVAQEYHLRPGVALTADQIAKLSTDIVWLVSQDITYIDEQGQTHSQTVFVPKVYVRAHANDLKGDGSLIAAKNIDMQLTGNLNNQGQLIAQDQLKVHANNITNQHGGLIQGDFVQINAVKDINNLGATLAANQAMSLTAGQNINNLSTTYHTASQQGKSSGERTDIAHIAHIQVGDGGLGLVDAQGRPLVSLNINAAGQYTAKASQLHNAGGSTQLTAQQGIDLQTINVGHRTDSIANDNNYYKYSTDQDIGSTLTGQGDLLLKTQGNITGSAVNLHSQQGTVALLATGDDSTIQLKEGRRTETIDSATQISSKSMFSKKSSQDYFTSSSDYAISSQIDGKQVILLANKDINLTAVQAISDDKTHIQAGQDIHIHSAENTSTSAHQHQNTKSGLMGSGGIGFSIGSERNKQDNTQSSRTQVGSTIGSLTGDTHIQAGNNYSQVASTLSSPEGNIDILAQHVNITSADNHYNNKNQTEYEKKGLTIAVNVPVVSAIQSTLETAKTVGESKNDRVNAMALSNSAWQSYKGAQSLQQTGKAISELANGDLKNAAKDANISVSITYGEQKNTTKNQIQGTTAQASQVMAGGEVNITATGAGEKSNLNIIGSDILGQKGTHLTADHDVNIQAAEQKHTENSSNRSQGYNAGVAISYGSNGLAFGVTAGGNYGKGYGNGEESTHRNSHVGDLNSQTTIKAGNHLEIAGGQVKGKAIEIEAQKLSLTSLQDTASYKSKQQNISGQATVGYGASVSANASKSSIQADYASVTEQTGLFAGDDGFKIHIAGETQVKGALITSTKAAELEGKNKLQAGTLVVEDIESHSDYQGKSMSIGGSVSVSGQSLGQTTNSNLQTVSTQNGAGIQGIGHGKDSEHKTSTTKGGIYTQNIHITDVEQQKLRTGKTVEEMTSQAKTEVSTTDLEQTRGQAQGALVNNFNAQKVQEELNIQSLVTQQFGENAPKLVADFSENRMQAIADNKDLSLDEKLVEMKKWDEGGVYRVAMHTAVGLLATGTVEGAVSAGGIAASAPKLDDMQTKITKKLVDSGLKQDIAENISKFALNLGVASVGATAGLDTASTVSALNVDMNNRQLHPNEIKFILEDERVEKFAKKYGLSIEEAKKELFRTALAYKDTEWENIYDLKKYPTDDVYNDGNPAPRALTYLWNDMVEAGISDNFKPNSQDQDREVNKNEVFADDFSKNAYYKYASVLPDIQIQDMPSIFVNSYSSYAKGVLNGSGDTLVGYKDTFVNLWENGISLDQITSTIKDTSINTWNFATDSVYRNDVLNDTKYKITDTYNSFQLDYLQGNFEKIADNTGQIVGSTATDIGIGVAASRVGSAVFAGFKAIRTINAINHNLSTKQETNKRTTNKKTENTATCINGTACFTAGTLIETSEGLKAIETFTGGELIWSRNDATLEYGYRPVIATKATENQPIFKVTVKNHAGQIETLETTSEHPFWIKDKGWLKASLLEQGMILLDRNNQEVEVLSQYLIPNHTDSVYNIEVDNFHTYHVGKLGVWVHNADCCDFTSAYGNATEILTKGGWVDPKTNKVMYLDPFDNKMKFFPDNTAPSLDHILPRSAFNRINGFNKLPKDVQEKLINNPANLQPLPKNLNSSKGAKIETGTDGWAKFVAENKDISPDYRRYLKIQQDRIRDMTIKEIQQRGIK